MLLAGVALVATVLGCFVLPWFHITAPGATESIDLQSATICVAGACHHTGLSGTGFYSDNVMITLWGSVLFALFVCAQVASRVLRGFAKATKKGYFWGVTMCGTVLTTAYIFVPDATGPLVGGVVERTWAPLVLAIGQIAGLVAVHFASDATFDDDVGEYKPVVITKPRTAPAAKPPTP